MVAPATPPETLPETPPPTPEPPDTPPADPSAPPAGDETMSMQDMMAGMSEVMGGPPQAAEGEQVDPMQMAIMEKQFEQDVRFKLQDMEREVKAEFPDASDTLAYQIGIATAKQDIPEIIKHTREAVKREAERDEKDQEQKPLHVEGGASGKPTENRVEGLAGVFNKINSNYTR